MAFKLPSCTETAGTSVPLRRKLVSNEVVSVSCQCSALSCQKLSRSSCSSPFSFVTVILCLPTSLPLQQSGQLKAKAVSKTADVLLRCLTSSIILDIEVDEQNHGHTAEKTKRKSQLRRVHLSKTLSRAGVAYYDILYARRHI